MITLPVVLETKYAANNVHRLFPDCILPDVSLFFSALIETIQFKDIVLSGG